MTRRRGHPGRDSATTERDEVIASTAAQLIVWGFARRRVYERLGKCALRVLGRGDSYQKALGGDRVEQLHEEWRRRLPHPWRRQRYAKEWLHQLNPAKTKTLDELAEILLKHGGHWPHDDNEALLSAGDPVYTPQAATEIEAQRARFPHIARRTVKRGN